MSAILIKAGKQNGKIETIRFLFAILIVYYHLTPILNKMFPSEVIYTKMIQCNSLVGTQIVIAFFIISGYFFARGKSWEKPAKQFIIGKIIKLWPAMAFSLIVNYNTTADFLNFFFLNAGMGIMTKGSSNPASWFACNLFWCFIIYYFWFSSPPLGEDVTRRARYILCMLLVIIGFSFIAHRKTGTYHVLVSEYIPFLTNGSLLCITGFSLGIIFEVLIRNIKKNNCEAMVKSGILTDIIWLMFLGYFIYIVAFLATSYETVYYQVIFLIVLGVSIVSKNQKSFWNHRLFLELGSCSYTIYLMQFPCFYYLKKTILMGLWKESTPLFLTIFGVFICVAVGAAVHYIIEIPLAKQLKQYLMPKLS